jgi:hypothetical protein
LTAAAPARLRWGVMRTRLDVGGFRSPPAAVGKAVLFVYVSAIVVALALGAYEPLFFGNGLRGGQGIDFFCVPKAYANLVQGRSAFDTWGGQMYGPHATWFVLHPAVALWVGAYFAWLPAWFAYGAWAGTSLILLLLCGCLFSHHAESEWRKTIVFGALLGSPISYLLLFTGNVHGIVLLAVSLLLVGLYELSTAASPALHISPTVKVASGLLLSVLSKPVLILVAPALLVARATRRATLLSLMAYALISLAFLLLPVLNPEGVGVRRLAWLALHPEWVKQQLNVYKQGFVLIPEMLDNAMHWLHMLAQSDYAWNHVQIFSLPVLVKGVFDVPVGAFRWVALLPMLLAPLLLALSESRQLLAAAWLVVLALASQFLGYAIAWEYQYTQLLVVVAALLALPALGAGQPRWVQLALGGLALLYLPTTYALQASGGMTGGELALMRLCRVGPALLLAVASVAAVIQLWRARQRSGSLESRAPTLSRASTN